jgi:pimeloyl-ACP methyl ester carboxylesterase
LAQPSSALHDGFVTLPGAKIFYRESGGSGVPVVFLHAFTGSSEVWERQIPAFIRAGTDSSPMIGVASDIPLLARMACFDWRG